MNMKNNKELTELLNAAFIGIKLGNSDLSHLFSPLQVLYYIEIADRISKYKYNGKFLDWGCGYGQMVYLLKNRGIDVIGYDIEKRPNIDKISPFNKLNIRYSSEKNKLPFEKESFSGLLSCGTLEHVSDINISLREINRILKSDGYFFIYMLPNKYSYTEWINEKRGLGSHPVKFCVNEIRDILELNGFNIVYLKRRGMVPRNLTGFPIKIKKIYAYLSSVLFPLDKVLSNIPLINYICNTFEIIAKKSKCL